MLKDKQIFTKAWFKCAGIRALKTMAQTALAMLTGSIFIHEVNWIMVLSDRRAHV